MRYSNLTIINLSYLIKIIEVEKRLPDGFKLIDD